MDNLYNLENKEEIDMLLDDIDENKEESSLNAKQDDFELLLLKQKCNLYISENEKLKKQISEINNMNLIQEKIELDKKNKTLINENERLQNTLKDLFKLVENHSKLKNLLEYQERELNRYKKKEKNSKKKKYSISDLIELREKGYSYRRIAAHYKVSPSTIYYNLNKNIK